MLLTLQDQKTKWRQIISEAAALAPQPEKLQATIAAFWAETEQHLSVADCEAFVEFAKQEERRGARRVAAAERRLATRLARQPALARLVICPLWAGVTD